ncbi:MAG TPA: hypothetical protein VJY35_06875 [Candidatus Eisenbacteria bacterium]|nr:hypothetical protein [Candidatus Eisenbacteria bacterium]
MGCIIAVALSLCSAVRPASAAPLIDWDPVYYWEAGATTTPAPNSNPGGQLNVVGTISAFGGPLADLNANIPAREYTLHITGLTSGGTTVIPVGTNNFYFTPYTSVGTIDIYEDLTPDADFGINPPNGTAPSTFTDGTVILTGTVSGFFWQANDFSGFSSGNSEGDITWTGGTRFNDVNPCPSLFTGGLTWLPSLLIDGYLFRHDGKIDLECPTGTRNTTWGRMKSLYR